MKQPRIVFAKIIIDDEKAIREGLGTLDYLTREFGWIEKSGIYLGDASIIDNSEDITHFIQIIQGGIDE